MTTTSDPVDDATGMDVPIGCTLVDARPREAATD
jgi:hypothetical protein